MSDRKDSIIVIAWPETNVIKVNMWYDRPMQWLRINKNEYYRAGHAAAILLERSTGKAYYFDFGRYHTSPKFGRIRDVETDPELKLHTRAQFDRSTGALINHEELLKELAGNPATHGDGKAVYSVYSGISFKKAFDFAKNWQSQGEIPYGPFDLKGTNCSRFVAKLIKAGKPDRLTYIKLRLPKTITASPVGNVKNARKGSVYCLEENINKPKSGFVADRNPDRTLKAPVQPAHLPPNAVWHSGEGAGSWFVFRKNEEGTGYEVSRYCPKGSLEFRKYFVGGEGLSLNGSPDYCVGAVSNARQITVFQNNRKAVLTSV